MTLTPSELLALHEKINDAFDVTPADARRLAEFVGELLDEVNHLIHSNEESSEYVTPAWRSVATSLRKGGA